MPLYLKVPYLSSPIWCPDRPTPGRLRVSPARYRLTSDTRCLQSGDEKRRSFLATLHVENFPDDLYATLRARARREHRSVAEEVVHLLGQTLEFQKSLSILDLQGLGRELWDGVDAADYVRRERDAWD